MLLCKLENQNQFNLNTDCALSRWLPGGGVVEGGQTSVVFIVGDGDDTPACEESPLSVTRTDAGSAVMV